MSSTYKAGGVNDWRQLLMHSIAQSRTADALLMRHRSGADVAQPAHCGPPLGGFLEAFVRVFHVLLLCSNTAKLRLQQQLDVVQHVLKLSTLCSNPTEQEVSTLAVSMRKKKSGCMTALACDLYSQARGHAIDMSHFFARSSAAQVLHPHTAAIVGKPLKAGGYQTAMAAMHLQ